MVPFLALTFLLPAGFGAQNVLSGQSHRPNLVIILADDLGYGDVHCFNPDSRIPTPHLDSLAATGMIFTEAHSSSAVCTPTRYSLLTGRYNWRSRLQRGVLGGLSPPLIEEERLTLGFLLQQQGYYTLGLGKWHLGMNWAVLPGKAVTELGIEKSNQVRNVDYAQPIRDGPTAFGFDSFFGISASLDMAPYTFIENDHVVAAPTTDRSFPMMAGSEARRTRLGPAAPGFRAEDVLPTLTRRAIEQIARHAPASKAGRPFFLYLALTSPHTPIAPTKEWLGRSGLNPYADFVMQTDASIGQVLDALDQHGVATNTLVFVTSDNGCSPEADFEALAAKGHHPSYVFRGAKADIFDGGHHVPFIASWPGRVPPGTRSSQLICLVDLMATVADVLDVKLPDNAGVDSISFLPSLLGRTGIPGRTVLVHHSINGSFAVREGRWKLILCPDSGGWSAPRPGSPAAKGLPPIQLYDLEADVGERKNTCEQHPEVIARLRSLLDKYISEGRSTPGPVQTNSTPIRLNPFARPGRP